MFVIFLKIAMLNISCFVKKEVDENWMFRRLFAFESRTGWSKVVGIWGHNIIFVLVAGHIGTKIR